MKKKKPKVRIPYAKQRAVKFAHKNTKRKKTRSVKNKSSMEEFNE